MSKEEIRGAEELALRGQYDKALAMARNTASAASDPRSIFDARLTAIFSAFMGGDTDARLAAVRVAKEQYAIAAEPRERSYIIGMLIGFITIDRNPKVFGEVFSGDIFGALRAKDGDPLVSLKNLAELSIVENPTSGAYLQIATLDAARILGAKALKLSKEDRQAHAKNILTLLESAAAVFSDERTHIPRTLFGKLQFASYYSRTGYLYGAVALVIPDYFKQSEEAYQTLYALRAKEEGGKQGLISSWVPHAYLNHALYLDSVGGVSRRGDMQEVLSSLVGLVQADRAVHEKSFLGFLRNAKEMEAKYGSYDAKNLRHLATLSPELKDFLVQEGWIF